MYETVKDNASNHLDVTVLLRCEWSSLLEVFLSLVINLDHSVRHNFPKDKNIKAIIKVVFTRYHNAVTKQLQKGPSYQFIIWRKIW